MSDWPITFISGEWQLIENPKRECASLRVAWRKLVGSEPDLGPDGWTVVGVHAPGDDPGTRTLRFIHAGNPRAVKRAARLVGLKYGSQIEIRGWLRQTERPNQWIPVTPRPFDLNVLTVWPEPTSATVRDSVVVELRTRPGHFLGRSDPTVAKVEDALLFPSSDFVHQFMRTMGIPWQAVRLKWRSVALAEEDQRIARQGRPG